MWCQCDPTLPSVHTPFYCHQNDCNINESLRFFYEERNGLHQSPFYKLKVARDWFEWNKISKIYNNDVLRNTTGVTETPHSHIPCRVNKNEEEAPECFSFTSPWISHGSISLVEFTTFLHVDIRIGRTGTWLLIPQKIIQQHRMPGSPVPTSNQHHIASPRTKPSWIYSNFFCSFFCTSPPPRWYFIGNARREQTS